jgi:hypothetical protein
MAWIESHQQLGRHPKTKRTARLLKISLPQMVGHLQFLWWWSLDYAQDGVLSKYDTEDIADAALWEGDPNEFVNALVTERFLDRNGDELLIHDWEDYAGKLIIQKEQNRQRSQRARDAQKAEKGNFEGGFEIINESSEGGVCAEYGNHAHTVHERFHTVRERAANVQKRNMNVGERPATVHERFHTVRERPPNVQKRNKNVRERCENVRVPYRATGQYSTVYKHRSKNVCAEQSPGGDPPRRNPALYLPEFSLGVPEANAFANGKSPLVNGIALKEPGAFFDSVTDNAAKPFVMSGGDATVVSAQAPASILATVTAPVPATASETVTEPAPATVITLPLNNRSEYAITEKEVDTWSELYPAVDVRQQLRNMRGWLESNPRKRKTRSGIAAFITRWLTKDQNRGGSAGGQTWPYFQRKFRFQQIGQYEKREYSDEFLDGFVTNEFGHATS